MSKPNYEVWAAEWEAQHPGRTAMDKEQFEALIDLFELSAEDIGMREIPE